MATDWLVLLAFGLFFVAAGLWNLKWPFIVTAGRPKPTPSELGVLRRFVGRAVALLILLVGIWLTIIAASTGMGG
ncbi:hypothetical protein [Halorussus sp. MSC15.2]|uniref:hypothetical protein n=1 Tax=Halorussus sp. MSC15.2 TaxID=2283638 RepID=UPI0013D70BEF|nr:hypothetical protein [Halorussus sp. MSC15.2]NEU59231.1 hypothetical protein [Halorussus sp. MSC15.2]